MKRRRFFKGMVALIGGTVAAVGVPPAQAKAPELQVTPAPRRHIIFVVDGAEYVPLLVPAPPAAPKQPPRTIHDSYFEYRHTTPIVALKDDEGQLFLTMGNDP